MKKMVKIVLITVLAALPALGTYVKTTLPKLGSAPDLTMQRTAAHIESGKCQGGRRAVSLYCKNEGNSSEYADPITEGIPCVRSKDEHDFPVNFLFNAIPMEDDLSIQFDIAIEKRAGIIL